MEQTLIIYTRKPIDNVLYDPRLAYSMHLGYLNESNQVLPFNHNSGVFFAKATENMDGSLNPKSITDPYVFQKDADTFGIIANRIDGDGGIDSKSTDMYLYAETKDFVHYQEFGMFTAQDSELSSIFQSYQAQLKNKQEQEDLFDLSAVEGIVFHQAINIPKEKMDYLRKKLLTPTMISVQIPEQIQIKDSSELKSLTIDTIFSDGTIVPKRLVIDEAKLQWDQTVPYEMSANIAQPHFDNPIAINRADPDVTYWNGHYYFIATNDADGNHTLFIREADTLEGLATAEEYLILDSNMYDNIKGLLWAPEFHEINGRLYIFHAATREEFFAEESRLMTLRDGGNPLVAEDWSRPERIVRMDGSELCEEGKVITLDMTCFQWENAYYVIWSQREFLPKDLGAWLYIAKLNPEKPWMLASDPIVLSKPDYGWGNNHTFVEEGPFALLRGDTLYITFSAAAVDTSYVVSYLKITKGKDLLLKENWEKNNYPILTARSVSGEFGTGHNAYVCDETGTVWNTYHARFGADAPRSSAIRRVHFDIDGAPMLDVTEELDLPEKFRKCTIRVIHTENK